MLGYCAASTIVLLIGMVLIRAAILRRNGIEAMSFGKIDKTDFLIPPFALFYFYLIIANAFHFPRVSTQVFFHSGIAAWVGVVFCLAGLCLWAGAWSHSGRVFGWALIWSTPINSSRAEFLPTAAIPFIRHLHSSCWDNS